MTFDFRTLSHGIGSEIALPGILPLKYQFKPEIVDTSHGAISIGAMK
jgi:hypothetical protein